MENRNLIIYCILTFFIMTTFGAYLIIQHESESGSNAAIIGGFLHGLYGAFLILKPTRVQN